jgi:hypothetical protein
MLLKRHDEDMDEPMLRSVRNLNEGCGNNFDDVKFHMSNLLMAFESKFKD